MHQRFSTNTFPSWKLAHPYRFIAHNGEINTVRGNVNWMYARRRTMESDLIGADLDKMWPIIPHGQSDTACVDNALELLVAGGYSLSPRDDDADPGGVGRQSADGCQAQGLLRVSRRADGAVGRPGLDRFTDGRQIGATLDRNGLRPARFLVTSDDMVVMASKSASITAATCDSPPVVSSVSAGSPRLSSAKAIGPSSTWSTTVPSRPALRPPSEYGVAGRGPIRGTVEVQQDQHAGWFAQVMDARDGFLTAIAALVSGGLPWRSSRLRAESSARQCLNAQSGPQRGDPVRLVGPHARVAHPGGHESIAPCGDLVAGNHQVELDSRARRAAQETAVGQRHRRSVRRE